VGDSGGGLDVAVGLSDLLVCLGDGRVVILLLLLLLLLFLLLLLCGGELGLAVVLVKARDELSSALP
jgi:hypothetical protein